jgi:hypothetical protein
MPSRSLNDANPRTLPTLAQRPKDIYHQRHDTWRLWKRHFKNASGWLRTASGRIINAGENPMAWFYEIHDSNKAVAGTGKGFVTHSAAMAAGRKKARELKSSGALPGGGVATVRAEQDSEVLVPRK